MTSFVCQECGYDTPQWLGRCPECGNWNSLKEIKIESEKSVRQLADKSQKLDREVVPKTLNQIADTRKRRVLTGFSEADGVFGGGIVPGSVTLLAGDPGVGKSTLLLQIGLHIARGPTAVLYVSGEESEEQVKLRASRIVDGKRAAKAFLLLCATSTDSVFAVIGTEKPALVIIDSIQTMQSESAGGLAGSLGQVRYAAYAFIRLAKTLNIPILLVGHVTKEGMVAGPMTLFHMVDTVLFLEGEKQTATRVLRCLKNRFGPIDEVGIFSMEERGLWQLRDPAALLLTKRQSTPGSVTVCVLEGTRAFLVEVQALVVATRTPFPRRVASGIDAKRLELLLAVLQKHLRLPLASFDVFLNVVGGLRISDPVADLGICLAIYSSLNNVSLGNVIAIAEVGLLGELRGVALLEKRVKEVKKRGFKNIISSSTHATIAEVVESLRK